MQGRRIQTAVSGSPLPAYIVLRGYPLPAAPSAAATPKSIAGEGCSHSVKVSQRNLPDALRILHRTELDPRRVYITAGDGSYKEVQL